MRVLQDLDVLTAEWDLLLIEIQHPLRELKGVKLKYVKGHQDEDWGYTSLAILAQLNVDADGKARKYQREHGKAHPYVLIAPHTGAHVIFPEETVTAKHISEMRQRSTGPPLWGHIQTKNQWSRATLENINWNAHAKALGAQIHQRVHLTKLVHECLATYHRVNRYDNGT